MSRHPWPHSALDVDTLKAGGWRATPFQDFVFKVAQRCNLACDYCYVYTKADQSWRDRPILMNAAVRRAAVHRVAEHADRHDLTRIHVILHGGEPLLAGAETLVEIASAVRAAVPPRCLVKVTVQTNAVLLTREALAMLRRAGITVGVSIDGGGEAGSRHRRRADGRSSFAAIDRALTMLREPEYTGTYAGILCVVDTELDPVSCYESLLAYRPPLMDFLLPHANWTAPPTTSPARWLVRLFDRWYGASEQETRIRLFEEIINLVLGGRGRGEHVGLSPVAVVVIESDGAIEQADSLKSTYAGAAATGLAVLDHPLDLALEHPGFVARQAGTAALSGDCLACPIHRVCGGGHYAHRFDTRTGFRNRSVYCADLYELVNHITARLASDLKALHGTVP